MKGREDSFPFIKANYAVGFLSLSSLGSLYDMRMGQWTTIPLWCFPPPKKESKDGERDYVHAYVFIFGWVFAFGEAHNKFPLEKRKEGPEQEVKNQPALFQKGLWSV